MNCDEQLRDGNVTGGHWEDGEGARRKDKSTGLEQRSANHGPRAKMDPLCVVYK